MKNLEKLFDLLDGAHENYESIGIEIRLIALRFIPKSLIFLIQKILFLWNKHYKKYFPSCLISERKHTTVWAKFKIFEWCWRKIIFDDAVNGQLLLVM